MWTSPKVIAPFQRVLLPVAISVPFRVQNSKASRMMMGIGTPRSQSKIEGMELS